MKTLRIASCQLPVTADIAKNAGPTIYSRCDWPQTNASISASLAPTNANKTAAVNLRGCLKMKPLKSIPILAAILATLIPTAKSLAQEYQSQILNKGAFHGTTASLEDFDHDGDLDIIAARWAANRPVASSVVWLENDGTGQFPRRELFEGITTPNDLDLADLDNDGDIDYLVSDSGGPGAGQLVWFQKGADGSFTAQTIVAERSTGQADIADFDGDGNLDVVAVEFGLPNVSIFLNDGALGFSEQVLTDTVHQVTLVEADDIDGDGDEDIVFGGGDFRLLFNSGNADFATDQPLFTDTNRSSARFGLLVTDLNDDQAKDILTFKSIGLGGLAFLDGAKNFDFSIIARDGVDLGGDILAADIDGNGLKDIIRQHVLGNYLGILYQQADLVFEPVFLERNWATNASMIGQMVLGDLDNDGDTDLVFPENSALDGDIAWFENIDGQLYRHYLHSEIRAIRIPKLGDIDSDGDLDVVLSAGNDSPGPAFREDEIVWFENRGDEGFVEWRIEDEIPFPADIELADVDGDDQLDIVATSALGGQVFWYKKKGLEWQKSTIGADLALPMGCVVSDIDADGDQDVGLCLAGDASVWWYLNDKGTFSPHPVDTALSMPQEIETADFNSDGQMDFAVAAADADNSVALYINDGALNFTRTVLATGQLGYDIELGDWDGNDTVDILVCFDSGSPTGTGRDIALFINDGEANFTDTDLVVGNERTRVLKLVDSDGDGDLDLAFGGTARQSTNQIAINQGGQIQSFIDLSADKLELAGIDAGDIDGSGTIALVVSDQSDGNLLLLQPTAAAVLGDFNQDGNVNFLDYFLFADAFGSTDPGFDLDGNGLVDNGDFSVFAENFDQ